MDSCLLLGIGALAVVGFLIKKYLNKSVNKADYPKDTVILHQLGSGPYCPSLSPFVIKVETYLRMNKIPYKNEYDRVMSSKGKTPWIQYNDDVMPDSHFIIQYLKNKFNIKINDKLTPEQKATGASFTHLVEDHLYWGLLLWRSVYDKNKTIFRMIGLNSIILWIFERKARSVCHAQGQGRHTRTETIQLIEDDLRFISNFIGNKKYFLGDNPTETDCAIFGQLCQFVWQTPDSPMETSIREKYTNLIDYCERIKSRYWPDWDELITRGNNNNKK
ncbi:hypothetical protein SNE40_021503 [Patella caerulea]|uniref:Failed axon connections homolog n=1 Tax=Patella caerulea TaxID=87958 RepID=A0AAN8FZN2_PATCE